MRSLALCWVTPAGIRAMSVLNFGPNKINFYCTGLTEKEFVSGRTQEPLTRCLRAVASEARPEAIFVLGYPIGLPDTHMVDGIVGAKPDDDLTTNSLINQGNSGGPVVDAAGCAIGIVYSGIESVGGVAVTGVKFAVPAAGFIDLVPDSVWAEAAAHNSAAEGIIRVTDTLSRLQTDHGLAETVKQYHDTIAAIATDMGSAELSAAAIGASYTPKRRVQLLGWSARGDAATEEVPTDPKDPRVRDGDMDGKPGVTLTVDGLIKGSVYVVNRSVIDIQAKIVSRIAK